MRKAKKAMKQTLSVLLAAVMLWTMLPALTIRTNAAESNARVPLNVTFDSASTNLDLNTKETREWSKTFNPTNTDRLWVLSATDVEIVGKLECPTKITSVVVRSQYYRQRANGIVILFSVDGVNWNTGYTLQEVRDVKDGACDIEIPIVGDDTEYRYVKVYKAAKMADATANDGTKGIWFDIQRVTFYCELDTAPQLTEAVYDKTVTADKTENMEHFFDFSNSLLCKHDAKTSPEDLVVGKFETPTVLHDIYIKHESARINGTVLLASVDGESWTTVATLGGHWANASNAAGTKIAHLHVSDTTAYNYIMVRRNHTLWGGAWQAFSIGFVGEAVPESRLPVAMKGWQRAVNPDGTYALRLLATTDSIEYQEVGMTIHCQEANGHTWEFDAKATVTWEQITEKVSGNENILTADSLGGERIYTAVLDGIPADMGLLSMTATPYAMVNGEKQEGVTKTVVMEKGDGAVPVKYSLRDHKDKIKISGRSASLSTGIACDFTASGIEFQALLAGDIRLTANCSADTYYTLYLNGVRQERLKFGPGTKEQIIAKNLPAGEYHVKLVKQTHVAHSISELTELTMCGTFREAPAERKLMLEFIGDSITCGYGVVGYPTPGVTYYGTSEYCDATEAYAYKTANLLDADYSMISVSGWAVLPDANNAGYLPGIYGKTSYRRSDEAYQPERSADVVVIHLGTNDVNARENYEEDFVTAAVNFIKTVMEMHPGAKIVWAYGSMMKGEALAGFEAKVQQIVQQLGGSEFGVFAVKLPYNQSAGNGHPSAEGHTQAADVLSDFIRTNCLDDAD